jgi:adenylate kinase family enzyme
MAKGEGFVAGKIRSVIEDGDLLPAWFSSHLFVEALLGLSPKDGIVFEGACRRLDEAKAFDETATWLERPYQAIFLNISDEEVEQRLAVRRGVAGRADDASDVIEHRLHEYQQNTAPAVEFLRSRGRVVDIDSHGSIEEVHAKVLAALNL